MKKQLKLTAAAMLLAVTAAASFAGDTAADKPAVAVTPTTWSADITDADNMHDLARAEIALGEGKNSSDLNVALVSQVGDSNIAYIQQSSVSGQNFAAIIQDQTTSGVSNMGYIYQTGEKNRAVIYQH